MYAPREHLVTAIYLVTLTSQHTPLCAAYQYFILGKNGDYKYGYRTNNGIVARQEADDRNQVSGHYFYKHDLGNFGLKYTSGVQGYRPEGLDPNDMTSANPYPQGVQQAKQPNAFSGHAPINHNKGYSYSFDAGNYKKEESSDQHGNTRGYYRYEDDAGYHDLSYIASDKTGFRITGGNLASNLPPIGNQHSKPNQMVFPFNGMWDYQSQLGRNQFITPYYLIYFPNHFYYVPYGDGTNQSYRFMFDTGNYKKEETSDYKGNIRGYFEFEDDAGYHNLSYVSNDEVGFQITGGNLAESNRGTASDRRTASNNNPNIYDIPAGQLEYPFKGTDVPRNSPSTTSTNFRPDLRKLSSCLNDLLNSFYDLPYRQAKNRSYYFLFDTGKYKIEETSDQKGNINGYFEYEDEAGHHDLSYVTDDVTGFHIIGGNLAGNVPGYLPPSASQTPSTDRSVIDERVPPESNNGDGEDDIVIIIGKTTENPIEMV